MRDSNNNQFNNNNGINSDEINNRRNIDEISNNQNDEISNEMINDSKQFESISFSYYLIDPINQTNSISQSNSINMSDGYYNYNRLKQLSLSNDLHSSLISQTTAIKTINNQQIYSDYGINQLRYRSKRQRNKRDSNFDYYDSILNDSHQIAHRLPSCPKNKRCSSFICSILNFWQIINPKLKYQLTIILLGSVQILLLFFSTFHVSNQLTEAIIKISSINDSYSKWEYLYNNTLHIQNEIDICNSNNYLYCQNKLNRTFNNQLELLKVQQQYNNYVVTIIDNKTKFCSNLLNETISLIRKHQSAGAQLQYLNINNQTIDSSSDNNPINNYSNSICSQNDLSSVNQLFSIGIQLADLELYHESETFRFVSAVMSQLDNLSFDVKSQLQNRIYYDKAYIIAKLNQLQNHFDLVISKLNFPSGLSINLKSTFISMRSSIEIFIFNELPTLINQLHDCLTTNDIQWLGNNICDTSLFNQMLNPYNQILSTGQELKSQLQFVYNEFQIFYQNLINILNPILNILTKAASIIDGVLNPLGLPSLPSILDNFIPQFDIDLLFQNFPNVLFDTNFQNKIDQWINQLQFNIESTVMNSLLKLIDKIEIQFQQTKQQIELLSFHAINQTQMNLQVLRNEISQICDIHYNPPSILFPTQQMIKEIEVLNSEFLNSQKLIFQNSFNSFLDDVNYLSDNIVQEVNATSNEFISNSQTDQSLLQNSFILSVSEFMSQLPLPDLSSFIVAISSIRVILYIFDYCWRIYQSIRILFLILKKPEYVIPPLKFDARSHWLRNRFSLLKYITSRSQSRNFIIKFLTNQWLINMIFICFVSIIIFFVLTIYIPLYTSYRSHCNYLNQNHLSFSTSDISFSNSITQSSWFSKMMSKIIISFIGANTEARDQIDKKRMFFKQQFKCENENLNYQMGFNNQIQSINNNLNLLEGVHSKLTKISSCLSPDSFKSNYSIPSTFQSNQTMSSIQMISPFNTGLNPNSIDLCSIENLQISLNNQLNSSVFKNFGIDNGTSFSSPFNGFEISPLFLIELFGPDSDFLFRNVDTQSLSNQFISLLIFAPLNCSYGQLCISDFSCSSLLNDNELLINYSTSISACSVETIFHSFVWYAFLVCLIYSCLNFSRIMFIFSISYSLLNYVTKFSGQNLLLQICPSGIIEKKINLRYRYHLVDELQKHKRSKFIALYCAASIIAHLPYICLIIYIHLAKPIYYDSHQHLQIFQPPAYLVVLSNITQ